MVEQRVPIVQQRRFFLVFECTEVALPIPYQQQGLPLLAVARYAKVLRSPVLLFCSRLFSLRCGFKFSLNYRVARIRVKAKLFVKSSEEPLVRFLYATTYVRLWHLPGNIHLRVGHQELFAFAIAVFLHLPGEINGVTCLINPEIWDACSLLNIRAF